MAHWGLTGIVTACALALAAAPALAHPHVWVDHSVVLRMGPAGVEGVRLTWRFDPLFSSLVLREFDKDGDRLFSPSEIQAIESKHLANLKAFGYFTVIKVDGAVVTATPKDFQASVKGDQVTYAFTLPLTAPAAQGTIEITVADPTFYTAFDLSPQEPPSVEAPKPFTADCKIVTDKTGYEPDLVKCSYRRHSRS